MSKFRIVDLFSGAGGLTFGFYYNLVNGEFVKRDNVEFVFSNEYLPTILNHHLFYHITYIHPYLNF